MIDLRHNDCLIELDNLIKEGVKVDLIVTDPPFEIKPPSPSKTAKGEIAIKMQKLTTELESNGIISGFDYTPILDKLCLLQDKINMYIWCNKKQIPLYLNYFVTDRGCSFDIIKWVKTNSAPTFNLKYLTDTEYCLFFSKGARCVPENYEDAKTLYVSPMNVDDKKYYGHPTIKPLEIIEKIIRNSSLPGSLVLDPFMGSGTTGVACRNLHRNFIGIELSEKYFKTANTRIFGNNDIEEEDWS